MRSAPIPPNEAERLEALLQTGVLDTEPEESFDRLTGLAARICGAPIALITLVDVDRQWFKSHMGLEVVETSRDVAFCAHAILQSDMLVVRDALKDERFADNPLVTSDPKIRFYAGSPLITHDGHAIGTFCVLDSKPRDLGAHQIAALKALSRHATTMLELRRAKELLGANAAAWERASETGDSARSAAALERLGDDLARMIEAREESELSVRDLELSLSAFVPPAAQGGRGTEVERLLDEVVAGCEHLARELGAERALSAQATRIAASARRARGLLGRE